MAKTQRRSGTAVGKRAIGGSGTRRSGRVRATARKSERPDLVRRPAGQMSEQEKRRTAAAPRQSMKRTQDRSTSIAGSTKKPAARAKRPVRDRNISKTSDQQITGQQLYERTTDYKAQVRREQDVFANTVQKANVWLKQIMDELGTDDRARAHTALKSVLHTLRDRLPAEEAVDLAAQLPTLIRGIYFEGWKPAGKPVKYNKEEFISAVRGYFMNLAGINHTEVIRGVLWVLQQNVPSGEIVHIKDALPDEFRELFGNEVLATQE